MIGCWLYFTLLKNKFNIYLYGYNECMYLIMNELNIINCVFNDELKRIPLKYHEMLFNIEVLFYKKKH